MSNPTYAALPPRHSRPPDEPAAQLAAEDRNAMALLRLIVAAGLAVGLLGLAVRLLG